MGGPTSITVADLIAMHSLAFAYEEAGSGLYRYWITCEDRSMDFVHKSSTRPALAEVLTRLAKFSRQHVGTNLESGLDASRDVASFSYWCQLYDYDPDSGNDHQRYVTIRRRAEQLKYVIGISAHRMLLEIVPSGEQGLGGLVESVEEMQEEEFDAVPDNEERGLTTGQEGIKVHICDSCGQIASVLDDGLSYCCRKTAPPSVEIAVEIPVPKCEFGTDFIAVVCRGWVVDVLLLSDRTSVYDCAGSGVQGYVNGLSLSYEPVLQPHQ